jgi:5-methylcytosine-specific restriction endonuclease McrA
MGKPKLTEYMAKKYSGRLYRCRDWLYDQYVNQRKYLKHIAKEAGTVDSTILFWIKRYGFPRISLSTRHKEDANLRKGIDRTRCQKQNRPRGKMHWKYTEVSSRDFNQMYNSLEYRIWKKAVHERDGYTCKGCGATPKFLDTHHILPVREFPHLFYAVDNGISLCHSCHSKTIHKEHTYIALFQKVVNSGEPKSKDMVIPNQASSADLRACVETMDDPRKG